MENISLCAIIAEYNPFHNGHLYHISKTKELLGDIPIVCIMSSSFTQRGEPAITDKWTRAKWALENGCDLVIELPCVYSIQSANRFAGGALSIINSLNCVTHISFGCETDNLSLLQKIAAYKKENEYSFRLCMALKSGNSFARANEIALSKLDISDPQLFSGSNCILAQEYLSFIDEKKITPIIIKRRGSYNDSDLLKGITSATSIRKAISAGNMNLESCVPYSVFRGIENLSPTMAESFFPLILSRIFYLKPEGLKQIHNVTEGLENRIYQAALKARSLTELLDSIKTKRYLFTRIQRIMLYILLDIKKEFIQQIDEAGFPAYARILAINTKCKGLLDGIKPSIPLIAKAADYNQMPDGLEKQIFEKEILATQMYSIFSGIRPNEDFLHRIIKSN